MRQKVASVRRTLARALDISRYFERDFTGTYVFRKKQRLLNREAANDPVMAPPEAPEATQEKPEVPPEGS